MKHLSRVSLLIGAFVAAACLAKGRNAAWARKPGDTDVGDHLEAGENDNRSPHSPSYDDIALRAYFIALGREQRGQGGDPLQDWMEAERQLRSGDFAGRGSGDQNL